MEFEKNTLKPVESKHKYSTSIDSAYHKDSIPLNSYGNEKEQFGYSPPISENTPKRTFIKALLKPSVNFLISSFLAVALLLVFLHADDKKIDYTLIGLRIPSLISLILSIIKIFIASGITMAIAENKWIRLSNGADLTLIDIYDGCTRGLSGVVQLVRSMHFDMILVTALLFQFGLLAMSPLSQELLSLQNVTISLGDTNFSDMVFYSTNNMFYTDFSEYASKTFMPPKIRGISPMGYFTTVAFTAAVSNYTSTPSYVCPDHADHCTYNNISQITTTMSCTNISDGQIVDPNTGSLTTLSTKITANSFSSLRFPIVFYSGEMVNRTYEKLGNFTVPIIPGLNITMDQASKTEYDPQYRPYVGDQVFVVAASAKKTSGSAVVNVKDLYYQRCWFNSSLDQNNWSTEGGRFSIVSKNNSTPIVMDYDRVIGNNTGLAGLVNNPMAHINTMDQVMVNAYALQQSIIYELVRPNYYPLIKYMYSFYGVTYTYNFNEFMNAALGMLNIQFIQLPLLGLSGGFTTGMNKNHGIATYILGPYYSIDMTKAAIFSLALFIPTIWWLVAWIICFKQSKGILRGNSQIILLSADLSPLARKNLSGFSNLDSSEAFKQAKKIRMRVGKYKNQNDDVLTVGLSDEKHLNSL